MSYKSFLDTKVFSSIGVGGGGPLGPQAPPPLWSLANIKCVTADIMRGAANSLHGGSIILYSMDSILSNVPEILHVQNQFFLSVLEFSKGKIHFFSKVPKN